MPKLGYIHATGALEPQSIRSGSDGLVCILPYYKSDVIRVVLDVFNPFGAGFQVMY